MLAPLSANAAQEELPQASTNSHTAAEILLGGQTTVFDTSPRAFSLSARNLSPAERRAFAVGNAFFNDNWVAAPASTAGRDGLGPLFNAQSCSSCHLKDGRGRPPERGESMVSMLLRLSIPGTDLHNEAVGEPAYGAQFQPRSIQGVPAEGNVKIHYEEKAGVFADGEAYSLRSPTYLFETLGYGAMASNVMISARVAPVVIGMGLLAAVPDSTLEKLADPHDENGDGVSGRLNWVWDVERKTKSIGRFGWKANAPTLKQQAAAAFLGDLGITSPLFLDADCTDVQKECQDAPHGGRPEINDHKLDRVTAYVHHLAVPAQREGQNPVVQQGKALFKKMACTACHVPRLETGALPGFPAVSHQVIYPYTDLLLHDMGEGLADHRPDFEATGREWRTPPLWGIGLVKTVNNHTFFLHDGRARNLTEAILWHGGEAASSAQAFRELSKRERAAVIAFLNSL